MESRLLVNWLRYFFINPRQKDKLIHASQWISVKVIILVNWFYSLFQTKEHKTITLPSLLEQLNQSRRDFLWAQSYYNSVTDKLLLDYATYEMLASQSKYRYLLKMIRSEGKIERSTIILNHLYERIY